MFARHTFALAFLTLTFAAIITTAHAGGDTYAVRPASTSLIDAWRDCAPDRARFCANVPPGGGRIVSCLMSNRDRLSPQCRPHTRKVDSVRSASRSCQPDAQRYCTGILPGGGRIISCLIANRDRLSPDCNRDLQDARSALRY